MISHELKAVTVIPAVTPDKLSFSLDTLLMVKVRSRKEPADAIISVVLSYFLTPASFSRVPLPFNVLAL